MQFLKNKDKRKTTLEKSESELKYLHNESESEDKG